MAEELASPAAPSAPTAVSSPLSSQAQSPSATQAASAPATASEAAPASTATTSPTTSETAPARPEGLADRWWDAEKNTLKVDPADLIARDKEYDELKTIHAAAEIKRLSVPKPEEYKAELPADLQLPEGIAFKVDEANPAFAEFRAWANAKGLGQSEFSEGLGLLAKFMTQNDAALAARAKAEVAKAGPNATQRVDVVGKWVAGEVGDADAKPIIATLVTDAHLRFFEKVMTKLASQGAASFSQSHRVPPDDKAIPGFANMSFEQRRLAQDQRAAARRTA